MDGSSIAGAIPALLAGAAYLDAKFHLGQDFKVLSAFISTSASVALRHKRDRLNIFYTLENLALSSKFSGRPFLAYQGKEWTYHQVYNEVLLYGTWLNRKLRVSQGEVVALNFMNCPEFIFLWFGLWSIGAIPAFINYNLRGKSLLQAIETSRARFSIIEEEVFKSWDLDTQTGFEQLSGADQHVVLNAEALGEIAKASAIRAPDPVRGGTTPQDMAILIFTSGTTGHPKGAIVSWGKYIRSMDMMATMVGLRPTDRYYGCMPLYHTTAAMLGLGCALASGCCFVIGRRFSLTNFWSDVRESRATAFQYVGETCRYLLTAPTQHDPTTGENLDKKHRVRLIFGNGLRPDVWQKFKGRFGIEEIVEFYGATEAPVGVWNMSRNDYSKEAVAHNGRLLSMFLGLKVAIVRFDSTMDQPFRDPSNGNFCKRAATGEVGELLARLDADDPRSQFEGYYDDEKATNRKILRDVFAPGDAWFRYGDLVRWDQEGRIFFVDRVGDTFRWKAENVSTTQVAEAFEGIGSVLEVNTYGVTLPNHDGRAGCAAIELQPDAFETGTAEALRVIAEVLPKKLQRHAMPIFLRIVPALERTGTNKQFKTRLRNLGVNPGDLGPHESLWWLQDGKYVPFAAEEWASLAHGGVKL